MPHPSLAHLAHSSVRGRMEAIGILADVGRDRIGGPPLADVCDRNCNRDHYHDATPTSSNDERVAATMMTTR